MSHINLNNIEVSNDNIENELIHQDLGLPNQNNESQEINSIKNNETEKTKTTNLNEILDIKKENSILFIINKGENISKENSNNMTFIKRKRGRNKSLMNDNNFIHDKNSSDNLKRKIHVHFLSFIVSYLNEILKNLNYKQRFLQLDYYFKKNIKNERLKYIKKQSIGDIIRNRISYKYKQNKYYNVIIYEQIKENEILNKIFSQSYLNLFKNIYYKSNNIISLKEYGLNKYIFLSTKVKMYKDLLYNIKDLDNNKQHIKKINECIGRYFLPELIFLQN
jgi:hypothetical protein